MSETMPTFMAQLAAAAPSRFVCGGRPGSLPETLNPEMIAPHEGRIAFQVRSVRAEGRISIRDIHPQVKSRHLSYKSRREERQAWPSSTPYGDGLPDAIRLMTVR